MNNSNTFLDLSGREMLTNLFDDGSFVELGAYVKRNGSVSENEGVICGYGSVNSRLVFAFAQDRTSSGGAVDAYHAKKIEMLYEMALKNGSAVIGIFDSDGATVLDGFSSVSAYGRIVKCISDASGKIPQIAILSGVCNGTMAAAFQMFDIRIAIKDVSMLYVGSPSIIGEAFGKTEFIVKNGLVSTVSNDLASAIDCARSFIELMPDNCNGKAVSESSDDVQRDTFLDMEDTRNCIEEISDGYKFVELYRDYAEDMITAFTTVGGLTVGIVANNVKCNGGRVTPKGAEKASTLISFCDSFSIPVVTLANSDGVEVSSEAEQARIASAMAKLLTSYASATTPKITVILNNLYGSSCILMGSKSVGADVVYALDSASIGALSPSAAVAFFENAKVDSADTRQRLEEDWNKTNLTAAKAAENGDIDDVITSYDLRRRICSALYMLSEKNTPLCKKHSTAIM
ncbi:MAG: hypothetical protein IKA82_03570 [Clostridia bacterium]|nr:hypothetical protein [Clostridia bacterium]